MVVNDETALTRLAEVFGVAVDVPRANAAVRVGKRPYDLRRGRWEWALSVMRTCSHHEIPLLRHAQTAWKDKLHELDRREPERDAELPTMTEKAGHRSASALQDHVLRRLDGKAGPEWVDAQTLDQATHATELPGVLIAFGPAQRLPALTPDDWDHAGRIGFGFTSPAQAGARPAG